MSLGLFLPVLHLDSLVSGSPLVAIDSFLILDELDDLGLPDDVAGDLRQAATAIQAETVPSEPDDCKLRRAGAVIVKGLAANTTSALGGRLLAA